LWHVAHFNTLVQLTHLPEDMFTNWPSGHDDDEDSTRVLVDDDDDEDSTGVLVDEYSELSKGSNDEDSPGILDDEDDGSVKGFDDDDDGMKRGWQTPSTRE